MTIRRSEAPATSNSWPALPYDAWGDTCQTLHLWSQIVGKVRTAQTPWTNHSWHVVLYVTPRGLTTGPIPHGPRSFQIDLDLLEHEARISTSDGAREFIELGPRSVASFYGDLMARLARVDCPVVIHAAPNEVEDPVPFDQDLTHASYDAAYARRFCVALNSAHGVFTEFRARFLGKCSPVHFFWGGFDLAVTRFSGRTAPEHPGGIPNLPDWITREAYSHEVSSCGFWPGNASVPPLFYAYAYPTPDGFGNAQVRPKDAFFHEELGEFVLPYDAVRSAVAPEEALMEFLQSTYEVTAGLGSWDRDALELTPPPEARRRPP